MRRVSSLWGEEQGRLLCTEVAENGAVRFTIQDERDGELAYVTIAGYRLKRLCAALADRRGPPTADGEESP